VGSNPAGVTTVHSTSQECHLTTLKPLVALSLFAFLAACSGGPSGALHPGLTARMDQPGATLDRAQALGILNQYRATTGAVALATDAELDLAAQGLAAQYAASGTPPAMPEGAIGISASAGYANFAETFSGWRNSPPDAAILTRPTATRAGIASVYDANSAYGVYWVLVLDD
jgi:uncharacterized protein YkwD